MGKYKTIFVLFAFLICELLPQVSNASQDTIQYDNSVTGYVGVGEKDTFRVQAYANDLITFFLGRPSNNNSNFNPLVRIYDPAGALIKEISGSYVRIDTLTFRDSGLYTV